MNNKLNYINNSQVLEMIADFYNLNQDDLSDSFADNCNSVSYGDADFTLVNQKDYISIALDAIFSIKANPDFNEVQNILYNCIAKEIVNNQELVNSFYINLEA